NATSVTTFFPTVNRLFRTSFRRKPFFPPETVDFADLQQCASAGVEWVGKLKRLRDNSSVGRYLRGVRDHRVVRGNRSVHSHHARVRDGVRTSPRHALLSFPHAPLPSTPSSLCDPATSPDGSDVPTRAYGDTTSPGHAIRGCLCRKPRSDFAKGLAYAAPSSL